MIPEKSLKTPAGSRRELVFTPEKLRALSDSYFPHNFREVNGALVLTEGSKKLRDVKMEIVTLTATKLAFIFMAPGNQMFIGVRTASTNLGYQDPFSTKRFYRYVLPDMTDLIIGIGPRKPFFLYLARRMVTYSLLSEGGECGAVYFDRFFTAEGDVVRYSELHELSNIALKRDDPPNVHLLKETPQGAGYFQLSDPKFGDIVDMVAYAERLYMFRVQGVTRLTGSGDVSEFRLEDMSIEGYRPPIDETLVVCDGRIFYFSVDGKLCTFDGAKVTVIADPAAAFIDFSSHLHAECGENRYYCTVTRKDGVKCVYCFDPASGAGFFFATGVDTVGEELLHAYNGLISEFSDRGYILASDRKSTLETSFAPLSGKTFLLESIAVEGTGNFSVKLFSEEEGRTLTVVGGECVHLNMPLRVKKLTLRLESENDPTVCVTGIRLIGTEAAHAD